MTENVWSKEFPTKPGIYWFYGYRYGKISCGRPCSPKLLLVTASQGGNSMMFVAEGAFMHESETECAHFKKADLPELPDLET